MLVRMIVALVLSIGLAACGTAQVALNSDPVTAHAPPYTLGAGDRVRVMVYGEQSVNGEYSVSPAGDIAFPLIGNVPAGGKTVIQLQDAITAKLAAGYLLDPRVNVEVVNFRPYYILGEVNRPGQYPYSTDLTVAQAVASAGGFTYRARKTRVFIRRADAPGEQAFDIAGGRPIWVRPGDTIRVGERYF